MKTDSIPVFRQFLPACVVFGFLAVASVVWVSGRPERAAEPTTPSPEVVATVAGLTITPGELSDALARRSKSLGGECSSESLKTQVLDELIREKVLLVKAQAAGLGRDPDLVRRWERMVVAKYEAAYKPDEEKLRGPSGAEVEEYYRTHAGEFQQPERVRPALIQIKGSAKATEEKRAALRRRAEKVLSLAQAPAANFAELARLHSDDRATRYSGGDGGWLEREQTPQSWPGELVAAVFGLETPGVIAPLVEAGGSFYVMKLIERQAAGIRPLAEVRDRIVYKLKEQRRLENDEHFYAAQRAGLHVEIHQSALQAVRLPAPALAKGPGAPPSPPSN